MAINQMIIPHLQLDIHVGCSDIERSRKQTVWVKIKFNFADKFTACDSDKLEDTICYSTLIKAMRTHLEKKQFHLIECLAKYLHQFITNYLTNFSLLDLAVTVNKFPQIPGLKRGVKFTYKE